MTARRQNMDMSYGWAMTHGDRDATVVARAVFVVPVWHEDDGSAWALLSEQDMASPRSVGPVCRNFKKHGTCRFDDACHYSHVLDKYEPALDALGGKRDEGEDCTKTVCREVFEESGRLIRDEYIKSLHDWIAAEPLDSANVYYAEEGKALFYYYPIPRNQTSTDFWLNLDKTFYRKFGQTPPDRTRSPSHLHWVKLVDPATATRGMPVVVHQCILGCAARCGRDECAFKSRADKTLGVKEHVERALQHLQHLPGRQQAPQPSPVA